MKRALKVLGGLFLLLLVVLVVNQVVTTRETKPAQADIGRILKLRGADVQVREDGPRGAPAIVLLHCFDCSMRWWDGMVPALARRHRVVRVDLLGHGGSAKPRDGYEVANRARLASDALDRLKINSAVVVGHSMGSSIAIALAERRPALVRGLVLIDQPASPDQAKLGRTAQLAFYPLIGPAMRRLATDDLIYDGLATAFAPGFKFPRSFVQDNRRMTYSSYVKSATRTRDYAQATPLDLRLGAVGKPALVLFGDREQIVTPAAARSFRAVRNTEVRVVKGAGHSPNVEKPKATARLTLTFAERVRPPPPRTRARPRPRRP